MPVSTLPTSASPLPKREPALLRLLFTFTHNKIDNPEHPAEVSWNYFHAIQALNIPFTCVPLYMGRFTHDSRWHPFQDDMNGVVAEKFINVVCGAGDGFLRGWTGVAPNVAILGAFPIFRTMAERAALAKYEAVIVPSEPYRLKLMSEYMLEVPSHCVIPPGDTKGLLRLFRSFRGALKSPAPSSSPNEMSPEEQERAKAFVDKYVKDDPDSQNLGKLLTSQDVPLSNFPRK